MVDSSADKKGTIESLLKERNEAVLCAKRECEANSALREENARINNENAVLAGHNNQNQKIKYTERLRNENNELSQERTVLGTKLRRLEVLLAYERHAKCVAGEGCARGDSENAPQRANRAADAATDEEVARAEQQMKLGETAELKEQQVVMLQQELKELRSTKELRLSCAELVGVLRLCDST